MTTSTAQLSRARTVLLWGLAFVWFSEMLLSGVRPLVEPWTRFWQLPPDDPRLYQVNAVLAASKGALLVLAVYALRSRSSVVRTALFVPMALVPPLNLAFPFRAQGFLLQPTMIGATLSVILWQTFFLFRDEAKTGGRSTGATTPSSLTLPDAIRYCWFAVNAAVLAAAGLLFALVPDVGVRLVFPCDAGSGAMSSGVTLTGMVVGTHLTAVATATWIATFYSRSNASIRQAVATSNTALAAIVCLLPLRQLTLESGADCASSSLLIYSIPLLLGWLTYAGLSYRSTRLARRPRLVCTGGQ